MRQLLLLFVILSLMQACTQSAQEYLKSGEQKQALDDYQGAIKDYDKAIELNPNEQWAYYDRADSKYNLKDYQGAIADYNKIIEIEPTYAVAYFYRGDSKYQLKDYQGAIKDYSKAIELNPNYGKAYFHRGNCKQTIGDTSACADWQQASILGNKKVKDILTSYCK